MKENNPRWGEVSHVGTYTNPDNSASGINTYDAGSCASAQNDARTLAKKWHKTDTARSGNVLENDAIASADAGKLSGLDFAAMDAAGIDFDLVGAPEVLVDVAQTAVVECANAVAEIAAVVEAFVTLAKDIDAAEKSESEIVALGVKVARLSDEAARQRDIAFHALKPLKFEVAQ